MDISKKVDGLVKKVKNDPEFMKKFQKDPIAAVESVVGVDLPDDQIKKVADGIKAKVAADKVGSVVGGLLGKGKQEEKIQ